ncbi:MAG: alanine racemase [Acidimicrobiia bacterium]|nr:alanine racemase [Acidimicrobiia bacterium]
MTSLLDVATPALVVDADILDANIAAMSAALPGSRCRPHVKAHKCTHLAREQAAAGHAAFTCATVREMEGMAAVGLGADLLLANEVLDASRLGTLKAAGHRVTVAVDSAETVAAAAAGGVEEVLVDVNVGLPRCGVEPAAAGRIADLARAAGLDVRGVMGYEGHVVGLADRDDRRAGCDQSMHMLAHAHADVGGEVVSAGGTGTYDLNTLATEIQAGSYVLMDTAYGKLDLPFGLALSIIATVVSVSGQGEAPTFAVADCGLKALGMDHGNPAVGRLGTGPEPTVWFCSDEHVTFAPNGPVRVGDRVRVVPAHVDPTVAYHEWLFVVRGEEVLETWPVDLRGW